jgi:hypothetical protein
MQGVTVNGAVVAIQVERHARAVMCPARPPIKFRVFEKNLKTTPDAPTTPTTRRRRRCRRRCRRRLRKDHFSRNVCIVGRETQHTHTHGTPGKPLLLPLQSLPPTGHVSAGVTAGVTAGSHSLWPHVPTRSGRTPTTTHVLRLCLEHGRGVLKLVQGPCELCQARGLRHVSCGGSLRRCHRRLAFALAACSHTKRKGPNHDPCLEAVPTAWAWGS